MQGTSDHMLTYKRYNHLEVIEYSNLDQVSCVNTKKFTFGLFMMARRAISWKSEKQSIIATCTIEAKIVTCFEATVHGIWLQNLFHSLELLTILPSHSKFIMIMI